MECKCLSSYIALSYIWAFLSIIIAIICPFGLYFSNWLEKTYVVDGSSTFDSVSSFRVCLNESSRISFECSSYNTFDGIFSPEWQAATLLMGAGSCLLVLVALTSIFGFCVSKLFNRVVVVLTFLFQLFGVVLFIIGILLFPAGMNALELKDLCGQNTDRFSLGTCHLGWAYILIIVGTILGVIATLISWSTIRWREKDRDNVSFAV